MDGVGHVHPSERGRIPEGNLHRRPPPVFTSRQSTTRSRVRTSGLPFIPVLCQSTPENGSKEAGQGGEDIAGTTRQQLKEWHRTPPRRISSPPGLFVSIEMTDDVGA